MALTIVTALLILDTVGINIGALVAALGIIGYVSYVFADNFRAGEEISIDGKLAELLMFELRGVVLRVNGDA